ncbi:phosphoribosylanthranilate isomerase [Planctomicrobium sp. SH527]|uniref:phosphoribosylanthranilate isomerase n=1 Tax=Planctomicrobium sp. SH527 TaxID=3448123 RepID=UPI003F5B585B
MKTEPNQMAPESAQNSAMWVKICGLTREEIAESLLAALPETNSINAIGLNFYSKSKRCVSPEIAARIVKLLPKSITPVGLFVNHSLDEIQRITDACGLQTIQLHGDETPDFVAQLSQFNLIKAFRVGPDGLENVARELEQYNALGITLSRCLIDALVTGEYGGTGHKAPWKLLHDHWPANWPPYVLAGGLTPENVQFAIESASPSGVDVASGVESSPGVQDVEKVLSFLRNARSAQRV